MIATTPQEWVRSYDNLSAARAHVARPGAWADVAELVAAASASGRRVTLRGAGAAFHDHALGDDVVLSTEGLPQRCHLAGDVLHATASTPFGVALAVARAGGRWIGVSPTGSWITLGGGVASNVLSRFSQNLGKVGDRVSAIHLLTADGTRRRLTPDDAAFRAVVGTHGRVGPITGVELTLPELPPVPVGARHRVVTEARIRRDLPATLRFVVSGLRRREGDPAHRSGRWVLLGPGDVAMECDSAVRATDAPLRPLTSDDEGLSIGVLAHAFSATSSVWPMLGLVPLFAAHRLSGERQRFVDTLEAFTFNLNPHRAGRRLVGRLGLRPWLIQQSFALPVPAEGEGIEASLAFVRCIRREARAARVPVDLIDLLTLPADDGLLSASRGQDVVVISVAVQGLSAGAAERTRGMLRRLARHCADLQGRIHLTKAVYADDDVLARMYGEDLVELDAWRRQLDPRGVFGSAFHDRLAGAVARGRGRSRVHHGGAEGTEDAQRAGGAGAS